MVSLQYVAALSNDVEYLNSRDATIMGSRNGHAPIYMWFTLTRKGYEGMRKDVERCLRNAHLLKVLLAESLIKHKSLAAQTGGRKCHFREPCPMHIGSP